MYLKELLCAFVGITSGCERNAFLRALIWTLNDRDYLQLMPILKEIDERLYKLRHI